MTKLAISPEGQLEVIGEDAPDLATYYAVTQRRRASHVEPVAWHLRFAFHLCRSVPHSHWLAEWTRTWSCAWRVNLSPVGGPTFGCYNDRREAIRHEHHWLEENLWQSKNRK